MYFTFIRDIAAPLRVEPQDALGMLHQLRPLPMRGHDMLLTLIKLCHAASEGVLQGVVCLYVYVGVCVCVFCVCCVFV